MTFLMRSLVNAPLTTSLLMMGCLFFNQAAASQPTSRTHPAVIQQLEQQGMRVIKSFAVGESLTAWVVRAGQQEQLLYTTRDGAFLINGVVLDAQGRNLTEQHQRAHLAQPDWSTLASSHHLTEAGQQVNEQGEPLEQTALYLFFDPHCPFSRLAWLALQPYRTQGVTLHWIPVAYLHPESRLNAAALLAAQAPATQVLQDWMQTQQLPDSPLDQSTLTLKRPALQANLQLMRDFGFNGTPSWVWQDEEGQQHTHTGMLRLEKISQLLRRSPVATSHPELMPYR